MASLRSQNQSQNQTILKAQAQRCFLALGFRQALIVDPSRSDEIAAKLTAAGIETWQLGVIDGKPADASSYIQGAKGVDGGAVRLVGEYAN